MTTGVRAMVMAMAMAMAMTRVKGEL